MAKRLSPSLAAVRRDLRVIPYPTSHNKNANHDVWLGPGRAGERGPFQGSAARATGLGVGGSYLATRDK